MALPDLISALLLLFQPLFLLLSTSLPPSTWTTLVFCFLIFIYLTALGLSCSVQDLRYIMQALLLWHTDSSYGCRLSRALELWHMGSGACQLSTYGAQA